MDQTEGDIPKIYPISPTYTRYLPQSAKRYLRVRRSTSKHKEVLKVLQSTSEYLTVPEVPQSNLKYIKVPRSTLKYPKVPQSTLTYPNIDGCTQKYLRVSRSTSNRRYNTQFWVGSKIQAFDTKSRLFGTIFGPSWDFLVPFLGNGAAKIPIFWSKSKTTIYEI